MSEKSVEKRAEKLGNEEESTIWGVVFIAIVGLLFCIVVGLLVYSSFHPEKFWPGEEVTEEEWQVLEMMAREFDSRVW